MAKRSHASWRRALGCILLLACGTSAHAQTSQTFTYQGKLTEQGAPANGVYDLLFTAYDDATGGAAQGAAFCVDDATIADGLIQQSVPISTRDPSQGVFLEIAVRAGGAGTCGNQSGFVVLSPRQRVAPAPYAIHASVITQQSPTLPGAIRFNAGSRTLQFFDGLFWSNLSQGAAVVPSNTQVYNAAGNYAFVVPANVYSVGIDIWGAGGGGGGRGSGAIATDCSSPLTNKSGGGGGGERGSAGRVQLPVTPGEVLTVIVGAGGPGGPVGGNGVSGTASRIRRSGSGDDLVLAFGGVGGRAGLNHTINSLGTTCQRPVSGQPGTQPLGVVVMAPAVIIEQFPFNPSAVATYGEGPDCYTPQLTPAFCAAASGSGGGPAVSNTSSTNPLPMLFGGFGGSGGANTTPSDPGTDGVVRIFWN